MYSNKTKKRERYYDQVIEIYKKTGCSGYEIEKMHIVPLVRKSIDKWIANFVAENVKPSRIVMKQSNKDLSLDDLESLKSKVADLEEQLRMEKIRSALNEKIIEIAEKKYSIQIRKKAGAKQ